LEREFQVMLCCDPRIASYAVQSHQLTYWMVHEERNQVSHLYTPDICAVLRHSNKPIVFEVKHSALRRMDPWRSREREIRRAYTEDHGIQFIVVTEHHIRVRPRLDNYEAMLRYAHPYDDAEADFAVCDALARHANLSQLGAVYEAALLRSNRASRAFSALMRLALRGEITLDVRAPLSLSTQFTRGSSSAH
jgi:hypothetical protein